MNINIIAVGKLKEDYLRAACAEYIKRIGRVTVTEIPENRLPDNPSVKEIAAALSAEGEKILKHTSGKDSFTAALCVEGDMFTSEQLAEKISTLSSAGKSALNVVIGGSFGLAQSVKEAVDMRLSLSKMTFPHQLARVFILEQLYRAFQINSGGKYHTTYAKTFEKRR